MSEMEAATEYTSMAGAPLHGRRVWLRNGLCGLIVLSAAVATIGYKAAAGSRVPIFEFKAAAPVVHTGEWCTGSGAATYTKTTLKGIFDRAIAGLLTYEAAAGESKFEASDVIRVGEEFITVCDSSWSILKVSESLPLLSHENRLIQPDPSFVPPEGEDSGYEAVMHDASSGEEEDYYVVRESVAHEKQGDSSGVNYHAQILKIHFRGERYHVEETCRSEFEFEGDSKGFEGAASLRGRDGVLYVLGLCEGNF